MDVCMSITPDFATMTATELRVYILEHRDNEEALHAYIDKLHVENSNSQVYQPEDDVTEAIAQYLEKKRNK